MKKRILSFILCLCMVVGMAPAITATAQAAAYASGDWSNGWNWWSQNQSRNKDMRDWGCFIVAKAKMLVSAGIASSNSSAFNPDIYLAWEQNNGFTQSDMNAIYPPTGPQEYARRLGASLIYEGQVNGNNTAKVWENIRAGKHTILRRGNAQSGDSHYVYVNNGASIETGRIRVFESWGASQNIPGTVDLYFAISEIHTYRRDGSNPPVSPQPSVTFSPWNNNKYTYVRETDAAIGQEIVVSNGTCTETGMYLYNANGVQVASAKNSFYDIARVYFKINEECHYTLTPGTVYKYKFYAIVNGKIYWGPEGSFRTSGSPPQSVTPLNIGSDFFATIYYPNGGKLVRAEGGDGSTRTNVEIAGSSWASVNSTNPKDIWHFIRQGNGSYKIVNEWCGWCLDVYGGKAYGEANVGTWYKDHGDASERWYITIAPGCDGQWCSLVTALDYPNYVMDVYGGYTASGTNVQLWTTDWKTGNQAQQFNIVKQLNYQKPVTPSVPSIQVTAFSKNVMITWNAVSTQNNYDSREYEVSIYNKSTGKYVVSGQRTSMTSYSSSLPAGNYRAEVRAVNTKYANYASGWATKDFTVAAVTSSYSITAIASPPAGGTVTGGGSYTGGEKATVTATPNNGYIFKGWMENGSIVSTYASYRFTVNANRTLTASFDVEQAPVVAPIYIITTKAVPAEGGTVTGDGSYDVGKNATVRATANSGYTFSCWKENGNIVSESAIYTFTVGASRDLTAVFEQEGSCAAGHSWGAWTTLSAPTCTQAGRRSRTCTRCGGQESETIAALGHNYQASGNYLVCSRCGDRIDNGNGPSVGALANFKPSLPYFNGFFQDVSSNSWYAGNVALAYQLGLMKGRGANTFSPESNMTLAEVITLAARIHSIYYYGSANFETYDGGNWYDPYVNYARSNGISTESYDYSRPATREEFVHILVGALPREVLAARPGKVSNFADAGSIAYAGDVERLYMAGVINGVNVDSATYFMPGKTVSRAEATAIVTRMVQPGLRV